MRRKPVSFTAARLVWAAVSRRPQATVRDLATEVKLGYSTVAQALLVLRDAGYIEFTPQRCGCRKIIIPFLAAACAH